MSLVAVTVHNPINKAMAGTGSIPNVNGSSSTRPIMPPNPGTAPIQTPSRHPARRNPTAGH